MYRKNYKERVREYIHSVRDSEPCFFCGENDSSVKHFHHVDPSRKSFSVGNAWHNYGMEAVIAEVAKCVIVCANDHARIHAGKLGVEERDGRFYRVAGESESTHKSR